MAVPILCPFCGLYIEPTTHFSSLVHFRYTVSFDLVKDDLNLFGGMV